MTNRHDYLANVFQMIEKATDKSDKAGVSGRKKAEEHSRRAHKRTYHKGTNQEYTIDIDPHKVNPSNNP